MLILLFYIFFCIKLSYNKKYNNFNSHLDNTLNSRKILTYSGYDKPRIFIYNDEMEMYKIFKIYYSKNILNILQNPFVSNTTKIEIINKEKIFNNELNLFTGGLINDWNFNIN